MNDTATSNPRPSQMDNIKRHMAIVSVVIYSVTFVVGVIGNGLVIYVTGFKMKKTVNSVWFLNLSLADFLFTAFLIFYIVTASQELNWHFGTVMCNLTSFVATLTMFASVFFLMTISLDRCLFIWAAVWAHNKRTPLKAQLVAVVIWVAAIICSIPFTTFRQIKSGREPDKNYCAYADETPHRSLTIFRFVTGFFVPFLVICISNVAIHVGTRRMLGKRKRKSQRIIFSIIFAFFICWLPLHVVHFIELHIRINPKLFISIIRIAGPLALCLAFLNSCLNPILYVLMCDDFQKKLRQSICFVLESALAEDLLSTTTARSLSSPWTSGRNGSLVPPKTQAICENMPESKALTAEKETMSMV